jgi:hypothetical protein
MFTFREARLDGDRVFVGRWWTTAVFAPKGRQIVAQGESPG